MIFIITNNTVTSQADLWGDRINAFLASGLFSKASDSVFVKFPSEQKIHFRVDIGNPPETIYLACGCTNLWKSHTGLAAIIKLKFHHAPYSWCMFAFCNWRRTLIKILQWDGAEFWILMKRLVCGPFHRPDTPDEQQKVTLKEIHWLCDGLFLRSNGAFERCHPKSVK